MCVCGGGGVVVFWEGGKIFLYWPWYLRVWCIYPPTHFVTGTHLTYLDRVANTASWSILVRERKEVFYLTTHSTHFIYGYMTSDIWYRTTQIAREETI